jgi:hypothetical protein
METGGNMRSIDEVLSGMTLTGGTEGSRMVAGESLEGVMFWEWIAQQPSDRLVNLDISKLGLTWQDLHDYSLISPASAVSMIPVFQARVGQLQSSAVDAPGAAERLEAAQGFLHRVQAVTVSAALGEDGYQAYVRITDDSNLVDDLGLHSLTAEHRGHLTGLNIHTILPYVTDEESNAWLQGMSS